MGFRAIAAAAVSLVLAVSVLNACSAESQPATSTSKGAPLPADAPVVAFYGDSYTLGTGASSESKRWSTIICAQRGWNEFNPSVNGLGFVNNRALDGIDEPALIVAQHPDIVFITMGLNDNFSYDGAAAQIHRAIIGDLQGLKQRLPDARFIVVEPFWYTDDRPKSLAVISGWVRAEAKAIGADYISGASHWIEHHPEWMAPDDLHPNDAGYAHMAAQMDAALTKLGL
ncbi:MAG: SGNH/GDSL hydrolase family protein [Pseudolysinimonas sp.]